MLTSQEIKEKAFEKAVFGGYDMGGVDDFLEEVSGDFTALQKENQTLKAKMKVLVEKVEEYRSTEDAMRLALLSAQKIGLQIENDAREKSDALVADAQNHADSLVAQAQEYADGLTRDARQSTAAAEQKAAAAQRSSTEFVDNMKKLCQKQLEFLNALDSYAGVELPVQEPAPAAEQELPEQDLDTTVKSIEDSVAKLVDEPQLRPDMGEDDAAFAPQQGQYAPQQPYNFAEDPQATRRYNFTQQ